VVFTNAFQIDLCVGQYQNDIQVSADEKLYNINEHIENIIDRHLNRNKVISEMWSGLQIAMVEKNTIIVINISERKFFDVKLHENFILCEQDKSAGCDHTAFVLDAS
jgi:hypothetical protein